MKQQYFIILWLYDLAIFGVFVDQPSHWPTLSSLLVTRQFRPANHDIFMNSHFVFFTSYFSRAYGYFSVLTEFQAGKHL